jgi:hypothetical protein
VVNGAQGAPYRIVPDTGRGISGNKKPAAFVLNISAAGLIRLGEVAADTRPADHHTSTLQKLLLLLRSFLGFLLGRHG